MRLARVGEFILIEGIKRNMANKYPPQVIEGIGDDCAVLCPSAEKDLIITTDTLVENIHFNTHWMDYYQIGGRAMAASLSDIAAMAGEPLGALLACSLPANRQREEFDLLLKGITTLGERYRCPLIGGDITRSVRGLFINITVIGEVDRGRALRRSNAKLGDEIWVTGWLGDSRAGLEYLRHKPSLNKEIVAPVIDRFLQPVPRIEEARYLCERVMINSMIDISDGLSSDLRHICQASRVGAEITCSILPISYGAKTLAKNQGISPYDWALNGGEDFELCLTAEKGVLDYIVKDFEETFRLPITKIGIIVAGQDILLVEEEGRKYLLESRGYNHFSRK